MLLQSAIVCNDVVVILVVVDQTSNVLFQLEVWFQYAGITPLIIHMKKLLHSDWLRAVQFKCNTSAKSATPVQKV